MENVRLLSKTSTTVNADGQTERLDDVGVHLTSHHFLWAMLLKSSTKFSENVKFEIGHFFCNFKVSPKYNRSIENSPQNITVQ